MLGTPKHNKQLPGKLVRTLSRVSGWVQRQNMTAEEKLYADFGEPEEAQVVVFWLCSPFRIIRKLIMECLHNSIVFYIILVLLV